MEFYSSTTKCGVTVDRHWHSLNFIKMADQDGVTSAIELRQEKRILIKNYVKLGKPVSETIDDLKQLYGDDIFVFGQLHHPAYSPDLAMCDFSVFPALNGNFEECILRAGRRS